MYLISCSYLGSFFKDNCSLFRIYRSMLLSSLLLLWCWDDEIGVMTWIAGCCSSPLARGWRSCQDWVSMPSSTCACVCSPTSSSSWSSWWVSAGATPLRPQRPEGMLRAPLGDRVGCQCLVRRNDDDLGVELITNDSSGLNGAIDMMSKELRSPNMHSCITLLWDSPSRRSKLHLGGGVLAVGGLWVINRVNRGESLKKVEMV